MSKCACELVNYMIYEPQRHGTDAPPTSHRHDELTPAHGTDMVDAWLENVI